MALPPFKSAQPDITSRHQLVDILGTAMSRQDNYLRKIVDWEKPQWLVGELSSVYLEQWQITRLYYMNTQYNDANEVNVMFHYVSDDDYLTNLDLVARIKYKPNEELYFRMTVDSYDDTIFFSKDPSTFMNCLLLEDKYDMPRMYQSLEEDGIHIEKASGVLFSRFTKCSVQRTTDTFRLDLQYRQLSPHKFSPNKFYETLHMMTKLFRFQPLFVKGTTPAEETIWREEGMHDTVLSNLKAMDRVYHIQIDQRDDGGPIVSHIVFRMDSKIKGKKIYVEIKVCWRDILGKCHGWGRIYASRNVSAFMHCMSSEGICNMPEIQNSLDEDGIFISKSLTRSQHEAIQLYEKHVEKAAKVYFYSSLVYGIVYTPLCKCVEE
ncbi:hypothetical protein CcNV_045 [Crangon crangon nudivirus]|uniref:Uncharacterized protein n=1 Tax=Crangon crangon nudivirus TaxID=2880838 RepID=A0AAE9BYN4_9VIRU|nr:hypothetical protein QKT25_gp045 [Crangon crangon nudivirus]UBZ25529.1 hypothetical protein CcNV_045 [Crangon crangon nudivirus]